jgi:hypothetical protein
MPDPYARFGQLFTRAIRDHLVNARTIEVPVIGRCAIENIDEPRIGRGNWHFTFDLKFPNPYSSMTLAVMTYGSGLMSDAEQLELPPADFEDDLEKEFPPEHRDAWFALLDEVKAELASLGLNGGDYYLIEDYCPSRVILGSLYAPGVVTPGLASRCQMLLRKHAGCNFWIQFDLEFADALYKGKDERLLIREDRIVLDLNVSRLKQEFPGEFSWQE